MRMQDAVEAGQDYLLSCFQGGLCHEFHQLRHGPGTVWTTACIGSTLSEFGRVPEEVFGTLLKMQHENGGWSFSEGVPPDADSTLRMLQFWNKVGYNGAEWGLGEVFVLSHQRGDGGIATFRPETVRAMGYSEGGWTESHPCVSALGLRILRNLEARNRLYHYLAGRLNQGDARAYWWKTPWYVLYEYGLYRPESISGDPVEVSLCLLLKARLGMPDKALVSSLLQMQLADGSFPASQQFRIPRPHQTLDDITGGEEVVEDKKRVFSTAAAIVAIARHEVLLN